MNILILFCISRYILCRYSANITIFFLYFFFFHFIVIWYYNIVLMAVEIMGQPTHDCIRTTLLHNVIIMIYMLVSGVRQNTGTERVQNIFDFHSDATRLNLSSQIHRELFHVDQITFWLYVTCLVLYTYNRQVTAE